MKDAVPKPSANKKDIDRIGTPMWFEACKLAPQIGWVILAATIFYWLLGPMKKALEVGQQLVGSGWRRSSSRPSRS